MSGLLTTPEAIGDSFGAFIGNPVQPLIWMALFLVMNIFIVSRGVAKGIETAGKILMPMLFIILLLIAARGLTLEGASKGVEFLFKPDFSVVTGETFLAALGQAFFSLSLGMGCMITYGSYLNKSENLAQNAAIVTVMDTSAALLAGLAMFPAMFAFGFEPTAGPGLVFVVVPSIFAQLGALGPVLSAFFFVALVVAALTSSVSLLEVVVAYLMDERNWARKKAVYISSAIMVAMCVMASLSLGVMSGVTFLGVGAFDFFDILTDKIFLAIGGMLLAIFTGWFVDKEVLRQELTNGGTVSFALFEVWHGLIKYVIPVVIAVIAVTGIMSITQKGLMIFGLAVIALLAV